MGDKPPMPPKKEGEKPKSAAASIMGAHSNTRQGFDSADWASQLQSKKDRESVKGKKSNMAGK